MASKCCVTLYRPFVRNYCLIVGLISDFYAPKLTENDKRVKLLLQNQSALSGAERGFVPVEELDHWIAIAAGFSVFQWIVKRYYSESVIEKNVLPKNQQPLKSTQWRVKYWNWVVTTIWLGVIISEICKIRVSEDTEVGLVLVHSEGVKSPGDQ